MQKIHTVYSALRHSHALLPAIGLAFLVGCTGPTHEHREKGKDEIASPVSDSSNVFVSPNDARDYRTLTLDNGIDVLLVSDPNVEKSAAALSVGVGLLSDPMDYQGMAHYLEHMLFLGTEKFPEPDGYGEYIQQNGGSNNAYTWLDVTNYMFEIKNSAYEDALDRFSDFFKTPLLDPDYIEKEKSAVNAEWSMRRELDYFGMYKLSRSLMGDHPANRFLIGNLESLADKEDSSLHRATVDFYQQYYSANLMKVAMVSDRSLDDMTSFARTYFGDIPNKKIAQPTVTTEIDFSQAAGRLIHYVPQEDQRILQLDFIIDANVEQFRVKPSQYLSYIIGSEMPNTPAVRLKELGWASALNVSSSPDQFGNYGVFSVSVDLTEEGMKHREAITNLVLGYLDVLKEQGVDDRYAAEFATSLNNQFRFLEKVNDFSYVSALAGAMQDYPSQHAVDANYRFEGFDADAVNAVLEQLIPERLLVWYVSKDEPANEEMHFYAGRYSIEPLELATPSERVAAVNQYALALPALNTLLPESFDVAHASPTPQKVIDQPNLEIWLQGSEVYGAQPKGFTQIYLNTVSREQGAEFAVLQSLWSDLYRMRQTTVFTEASIAGMNASVSNSHGLKLTFSGFTDKQSELIEIALKGLAFKPTEEELAQAVDRFARGLENSKRAFPVRQLRPALSRLTESGRYSPESLKAALEDVDLARLNAFVDDELRSAYARIYMFGNYSEASVQAVAAIVDDALPNRTAGEYVRASVYKPSRGQTLVAQSDLPVEDLGMLYLFAAPTDGFENIARGEILGSHLANRAFNQLRTEEQLGYAAGGFATQVGDHPYIGFYIQTPVKAPVAMLERFDAFRAEYREILAELGEEEFELIKAGLLTNLTEPPKNLAEEAGPFISDWNKERYAFDSRAKLIAAAQAVTLADIRDYYDNTVMVEDGARLLVQLRGRAFADQPFATLPNATIVESIEDFHATMPRQ